MFNKPVRQYVKHHKHGRSHLLVNLEFDYLHCWVRPPNGNEVTHPTVLDTYVKMPLREFVPIMQSECEYEDDWVITDIKTLYTFTPAWVPQAFEQFLGIKLHQEGSEEFQAILDKHVEMLGGEDVDLDEESYVHDTSHAISKDHQKNTLNLTKIGHPKSALKEFEKDSIAAILERNALPKEGEEKQVYTRETEDYGTATRYQGYNKKTENRWHGSAIPSKREAEQR